MGTLRFILPLALLISGCDLFDTRNPEPPDAGRGTWSVPRVPADVLSNLSSAMFERNAVNYMLSFDSDSFRFIADAEALSRDPSLAEWNYDDESNHASRLFSEGTLPSDSAIFAVFSGQQETILGDSAQIIAQYSLTAEVALAGAPGDMGGTAEFSLRIGDEGYWIIRSWRDQRTEEQNTWSDLKSLVR